MNKKRTLSSEQLAKMKEGRERAAKHRWQMEQLSVIDDAMRASYKRDEEYDSSYIFKRRRHKTKRK